MKSYLRFLSRNKLYTAIIAVGGNTYSYVDLSNHQLCKYECRKCGKT